MAPVRLPPILVLAALAVLSIFAEARGLYGDFQPAQCKDFPVTKGDGEGLLRHCDNGTDQLIYLSGELDPGDDPRRPDQRDLRAIGEVIKRLKTRPQGRFKVLTRDATGGDVEWHQRLMMAVEDHCPKGCKIETEVHGSCLSACNQLHLTCARGAVTTVMTDGRMCEHASVGEPGDEDCRKCDPKPPKECNICGPDESVDEYTSRCGRLLARGGQKRMVDVDPERRRMIESHAKRLAETGVFSSSSWTCVLPPWANPSDAKLTSDMPKGAR